MTKVVKVVIPELEEKALIREYRDWKDEEIEILKSYYKRVDLKDIASVVHKSYSQVRRMKEKLGLN